MSHEEAAVRRTKTEYLTGGYEKVSERLYKRVVRKALRLLLKRRDERTLRDERGS